MQTTSGPVDASSLGFTLMHEHLAIVWPSARVSYPHLYDLRRIWNDCVSELRMARDAGIDTIVDLTTPDLGRDPALVAEAAEATGMKVVMCTGNWLDVPRSFHGRSPAWIADLYVREIEVGLANTAVRAGIIKVASDETITDLQELVLRAAAMASLETGVAISTHSLASNRTGLRQLDILEDEGVSPSRVIIGHSTDGETEYLDELYRRGAVVAFDQYGTSEELNESRSIRNLVHCLRGGHASQTLVSQDHAAFFDWDTNITGSYSYVMDRILPILRRAGVSEGEIQTMTRSIPARLLAPL